MRILILGGDGFCGWPASLHLSDLGHDVMIADNLSRRNLDAELKVQSLTPIASIEERLDAWRDVSGLDIGFINLDLATEYPRLVALLQQFQPEAVVHFAEQCSAPYSMRNSSTKRFTVENNLRATHNLLASLEESRIDASLVHLGSIGVYGYDWSDRTPIPEGYLDVMMSTTGGYIGKEILHPSNPGSIYHMTKSLDQLMFAFYARSGGLRITDLHQGVIWGTQTVQSKRDNRLINRFNYDAYFGTVVNRFVMQGAIGHALTVYGTGMQTRAFIHIQDAVQCIELTIANPPSTRHRPRIFNQVTETRRVLDLARLVSNITGTEISFLPNPRREAAANELFVQNHGLLALGMQPAILSEALLLEDITLATKHMARADPAKIIEYST